MKYLLARQLSLAYRAGMIVEVLPMSDQLSRRAPMTPLVPVPAVGDIDLLTGQPLSADEVEFRQLIQQENEFIALDAEYAAYRAAIHQPLAIDEMPQSDAQGWTVQRPVTSLQLPFPTFERELSSQESVVQLLRHMVGEFPAKIMHLLFEIANDPPFYRRPDITISINDVLDRLGYTRDGRGIHYSVNRKRLTLTLHALYLTDVEVYQRRGKTTKAFSAPLLSVLGFTSSNDNVRQMPIPEVFARGLPDVVQLSINAIWYRGVRDAEGRPGTNYQLLPRTSVELPARRRGGHRGRGSVRTGRSVDNLRVFVQRCQVSSQAHHAEIALASLLQEAGITNKNASQATTTLRRALDKLVSEAVLTSHRLVQRGATAVVELRW
jgi:hypothetical protein